MISPTPPRMVVVDNPGLADAIRREWQARANSTIDVTTMDENAWRDWKAAAATPGSDPDIIIYPVSDLGSLVEAKKILPIPSSLAESGRDASHGLAISDWLPSIWETEVRWGSARWGIPFASGPMLLIARQDILASRQMSVPQTWSALRATIEQLRHEQEEGTLPETITSLVVQPSSPGWQARSLLARVASYVRSPRKYSDVFDFANMLPLIDTPPFVRALEEMASDLGDSESLSRAMTPSECYAHVRSGRSVFAIGCWPTRSNVQENSGSAVSLVFSLLPGADEVYLGADEGWQPRQEVTRVPMLAASGTVGSVVAGTRRQQASWNLLQQISSSDWSRAIAPLGKDASPIRVSQLATPLLWLDENHTSESLETWRDAIRGYYASTLTMNNLRIPAAEQYLSILDEAVRATLTGQQSAAEALSLAAQRWSELLEFHGLEPQGKAYRRQLGLDP